jgi:hypothetical protein
MMPFFGVYRRSVAVFGYAGRENSLFEFGRQETGNEVAFTLCGAFCSYFIFALGICWARRLLAVAIAFYPAVV